ncbi:MAG: hypothetical protein Q4E39_04300 [bacterium]|nr:hypothetical protein [bacterium]
MDRIKYYSPSDWSGGYNLEKAEQVILNFDNDKEYDINDILEFFNIYKYFDNKVYLTKWDDDYIQKLKDIVKQMKVKAYKYFNTKINEDNIISVYETVDIHYKNEFFELFSNCIEAMNISNEKMAELLQCEKIRIRDVLEYKTLVIKYDDIIKEYLMNNNNESVELLIGKYYIDEESYDKLNFPSSLTLADKEKMILKYIEYEFANLNFIRIIAKIQSNKDSIVVDDKTKLKAQKRREEIENNLFKNTNTTIEFGIGVVINDNQEEASLITSKGNDTNYSYSGKWIKESNDYPTLLNNFIYLFNYVDPYFRIDLINKKCYSGIFERINYKVVRSYNPNQTFNNRAMVANMQIAAYYNYLNKNNIRLEDIIEWFFKEYLKSEFDIDNYIISMPSANSNYFEKCKSLLPEFDLILKEYKYYCEDGIIDQELVNISSTQMFFKDIPSLNDKKYIYANKIDDTLLIQYYFFSDQCLLNYNPITNKSYGCFYELLRNIEMKYSDYNIHEQKMIDWLVDKELLAVDNNYIKLKNKPLINIYADLYFNEVINYWRYPKQLRNIVDSLIENGILYSENTLFSKPEQDYFNYYLNMSEFIDGFDIRNSNLHGSQSGDRNSEIHSSRYMMKIKKIPVTNYHRFYYCLNYLLRQPLHLKYL